VIVMTYDEALAVQRRHEQRIMAMPGVTGIGVKLRDHGLVLEVTVDPSVEVPAELAGRPALDGLALEVEHRRYEAQ
jgi:hypothetical protein